jgi:hypothetical protein
MVASGERGGSVAATLSTLLMAATDRLLLVDYPGEIGVVMYGWAGLDCTSA